MKFEEFFKQDISSDDTKDDKKDERGKYLSRVFGMFSEEIVDIWCQNIESKYENVGRPTVYTSASEYYTLDFTFKDKDNRHYIVEMKSEIQYQNYKFMVLNNEKPDVEYITDTKRKKKTTNFLRHHQKKPAFELFLNPENKKVLINKPKNIKELESSKEYINGKKVFDGSILVWGSLSKDFKLDEFNKYYETDLNDIVSVENIINDLINWNDENYRKLITKYTNWNRELFTEMLK